MAVYSSRTGNVNGNVRRIFDREPRIRAAGLPTPREKYGVADVFKHYVIQDEVDALVGDAIIPPEKPKQLPPLRKPLPLDMRHALGGQCAQLINPPMKTKFQTLTNDFRETIYKSYWNKPVGKTKNGKILPDGFDIGRTTFGKKTVHESLYDVILPKEPTPCQTLNNKAGVQTNRNYNPSFDQNVAFGVRSNTVNRGRLVKYALRYDKVCLGESNYNVVETVQSNYQKRNSSRLGKVLAPNLSDYEMQSDFNIEKPQSHGLPACLSYCDLNPQKDFYLKCLSHLNSVRNTLTTTLSPSFFNSLYFTLKCEDKTKSGWLRKELVYKFCVPRLIELQPSLIEPLLIAINAFDGENIEYKRFIEMINFKQPLPDFPHVTDISKECLDYRTTYSEMTKPGQETDKRLMAGVSSGRYLQYKPGTPERYSGTSKFDLSDERDMKAVLNPSAMTILNVSHRDMYCERDRSTIRRVFEASGETFTDEEFNKIYERAQEYHPQGLVCYETFRRSLSK